MYGRTDSGVGHVHDTSLTLTGHTYRTLYGRTGSGVVAAASAAQVVNLDPALHNVSHTDAVMDVKARPRDGLQSASSRCTPKQSVR